MFQISKFDIASAKRIPLKLINLSKTIETLLIYLKAYFRMKVEAMKVHNKQRTMWHRFLSEIKC